MTTPDPSASFDTDATMRAARILADLEPGPATRLDAFLLLAGQEDLWRRDGPGADFGQAVRRYEAAAGTTLARPLSPPSFGVVKWRGAERRHEVAVWLAGRFLGWLSSPTRRAVRSARDWRADTRLLVSLGLSHAAARAEPPCALPDAERRVTELALAGVVDPRWADRAVNRTIRCGPAQTLAAAPAAGRSAPRARRREPERGGSRAGAERPERAVSSASTHPSMEIRMNPMTSTHEPAIRDIPLCRLALAPENVRKTPPDEAAEVQLRASIAAHGLLKNLVARPDAPDSDGVERFAVVAGGRRLAALKALAESGTLHADHPVPCKIAAKDEAAELSTAENVNHLPMHPADQVVAFAGFVQSGTTVAAIATRFGVSERLVEQRLRLGNAAPELIDAYRAEAIDLETLKAFAVTTDHERQLSVWEQVSAQGHRPSAWQVKRLLTEERVPASAAIARFVGVDAYEAAGGPVLRDLFADEYENGVWLEDPKLLTELAMKKLATAVDELATRWKWAEAMVEVDWSATARYGRIRPQPSEPTDAETAEIERLRTRHDDIATLEEHELTEELSEEAEGIEMRLDTIEIAVDERATFRPEDFALAGCIATIGRDGSLHVIEGLVKPEDIPKETAPASTATDRNADTGGDATTDSGSRVDAPALSTPLASPPDPRAKARTDAGVGIGLADDLRAIRTALIKAHLADDFEAAFDLVVFQMVRAVFARGYTASWHALDIAFNETAERPTTRANDDGFAAWSPGEAMLSDWSHLSFEWMEGDDDAACFAALARLPRADKERLFAAAVARTVKGQLAFEHDARPELEATVARLGIDFAKHVRPTAQMLWSRITKSRILDIARETFGAAWAATRAKYRKADLAQSMETAFAAGPPPVGLGASAHAAALAWSMPGFAAFDAGGADAEDSVPAKAGDPSANTADASADAAAEDKPRTTSVVESIESPAVAEQRAAARAQAEARNGNGAAVPAPEAGEDRAQAHTGANGNGHAAPAHAEGEAGPEAMSGGEGPEAAPANGTGAGEDALDIPEFLRRIH